MKKLLLTSAILTCLTMIAPIFTRPIPQEAVAPAPAPVVERPEEPNVSEAPFFQRHKKSYDESCSVKLLTGGEVVTLSLGEYLQGVVAAEMPAAFPEEALKAQAVAARTYTLYKMALYDNEETRQSVHQGAMLCDDPGHCTAYVNLALRADALWGSGAETYIQRIQAAVKETDGEVLLYEDQPIAAVFCAASSEKTESAEDVWNTALPYLVSVDSPGGADCVKYQEEVRLSQSDFCASLQKSFPQAVFSGLPADWFGQVERSSAGGIKTLSVGGVTITGVQLRALLGLNSTNFTIRTEGEELVFRTTGYGHGVGMSQYGARYFALSGMGHQEILLHYYPQTTLSILTP